MDVTIIIPTYNRIWSLPKAIASCKNQGQLSVQIIVVDDGSTDGTWDMLEKQTGIEIYKQQKWGKPWAVNKAFELSKGKYIKFLDSDDWIIDGSILKQYQLAEQKNADVVVAGYDLYDTDQYIRTQSWFNCDDFIAQNLGECDSSHYSAFLFRRDFIADIPHRTSFAAANFASRDDRCFMLEVALKKPRVALLAESALAHVYHQQDRLQFKKKSASVCTNYQHLLIYKNIIKQLAQTGQLNKRRIAAAINVLWPLCHWIAKDDIDEAKQLHKWILELDPNFKIPHAGISGLMYNKLGFKTTEKIFSIRRLIKYGWSR